MSAQEAAKQRILGDMIDGVSKDVPDWKVLVVDAKTLRIISSACRMYDVMEKGITVVENISIPRQPLRKLDAIYFLSPTEDSVEKFIADWDKDKPLYKHAHVFFCNRLPDELFKKITASKAKRKIRNFKELNVDFLAFESQAFHLDERSILKSLFAGGDDDALVRIADKLMTACLALGEYPYIRHTSTSVASDLASTLQKKLREIPAEAREQLTDGDDRAILLIVDRTIDPVAPFLHEFTYQAMVYDLLPIQNDNTYKYPITTQEGKSEKTVTKEVLLDEHDFLWPKLRHMHIADCISRVIDDFNGFLKTNKAVSLNREASRKVSSLKEMSKAMKDMPQFQEMFAKFSLHIRLAGECMDQYNGKELEKIALVEQDLATGRDASGESIDKAAVIKSMDAILRDDSVSTKDKLRLILIFLATQDRIKDSEKEKRLEIAGLGNEDLAVIEHMRCIGVSGENGFSGRKERERKLRNKKKKKDHDNEEEHVPYQVSRYVPVLRDYLEDLCSGDLSPSTVPFVGDEPKDGGASKDSAPKAKSLKTVSRKKQSKDKLKGESSEQRGARIIVFIVGGMTWSEVRTAYDMTKLEGREVLIGSTHIITPASILDEVAAFDKRREKKHHSDEEV